MNRHRTHCLTSSAGQEKFMRDLIAKEAARRGLVHEAVNVDELKFRARVGRALMETIFGKKHEILGRKIIKQTWDKKGAEMLVQWFMQKERLERKEAIGRTKLFLENAMAQIQEILKANKQASTHTIHVISNTISPYHAAIESLLYELEELK